NRSSPAARIGRYQTACSSIDLAEHDVHRADDRDNIGEHMAAAHEICRLQKSKTRRSDLATVRPIGAIGNEVDAELALRPFDSLIDLACRPVVALGIQFEMMHQRLHRALLL